MSAPSKHKMLYGRKHLDPILSAVLAAIHKTAETPPPGFLTRDQWRAKWGFKCQAHAGDMIAKAVEIGKLEKRSYRVVTKNGRLTMLAHYGPPGKKPR